MHERDPDKVISQLNNFLHKSLPEQDPEESLRSVTDFNICLGIASEFLRNCLLIASPNKVDWRKKWGQI